MFWKIYFISDFLWFLKMIQFPFLFFFSGNRQVDFIVFSTSFVSMFWVTLPLKSLCFCIILQLLLCLENLYFSQMKHFNSLELTSVCWLTLSSAFVLLSPSWSLLFFVPCWTSIGASMIESFPSLGFSQEKDLLSLSKMFFILGMTWSMMTSLSWLSIYLEGIFLYILFIANLQSEPN